MRPSIFSTVLDLILLIERTRRRRRRVNGEIDLDTSTVTRLNKFVSGQTSVVCNQCAVRKYLLLEKFSGAFGMKNSNVRMLTRGPLHASEALERSDDAYRRSMVARILRRVVEFSLVNLLSSASIQNCMSIPSAMHYFVKQCLHILVVSKKERVVEVEEQLPATNQGTAISPEACMESFSGCA